MSLDKIIQFEQGVSRRNDLQTQDEHIALFTPIVEGMELDPMAALRRTFGISITSCKVDIQESNVFVYVTGKLGDREDQEVGALSLDGSTSHDFVNLVKGAVTNAKARLTASLLGYGKKTLSARFEQAAVGDAHEPTAPEQPQVNQEQAAVVEDTRKSSAKPVIALIADTTNGELSALVKAIGTEANLAAMHKEAAKLAAPEPDFHSIVEKTKKVVVEEPAEQGGMFASEPMAPAPAAQPITVNAPAESAPVTVPEPAAPANGEEATLDVEDIKPNPPKTDKPTQIQFRKLNERCTHLARNVLPKAGKDAPNALGPYLKKKFGTSDLSQVSLFAWENELATLEAAQDKPAELYAIIKGK